MRRRLLAGLVVALVVGSAGLLAVQPAAAATYPDAEAACETTGDGQRLIGVLPGSSTATDAQVLSGSDGNASLYPGTTLRIALCEDGSLLNTYGSEWELPDDADGIEVVDTSDATATVRVTGETPHVDVLGLVERKEGIPAVAIDVQRAATVDSELTNETLTFESGDAARQYEDAESEYLSAVSDLESAAADLNDSADAVESGDADPDNVTGEVLPAVNESRESVAASRSRLETRLYDAAYSGGDSTAVTALEAARERERAADEDAEAAMESYLGALEAAESDAQSTALVDLGGALVVGLLVGAVPGWKLTANRLERIRQDREVNSSVSYTPRVLAWAVGLAVAVLALTLVALFALGGFDALGGLL